MPDLTENDSPGQAFTHRNNPSLPDETCARLTNDGVGVLDWGTGLSWDHTLAADDHTGAAKRSFEVVRHLNEHGGYGVMHTPGFDEISIGRVEPPCIRFKELEDTSGETRYFKVFQFDTYDTVDADEFPAVKQFATNYVRWETLQMIEEKDDTESSPRAVTDAYIQLDLSDRLQRADI